MGKKWWVIESICIVLGIAAIFGVWWVYEKVNGDEYESIYVVSTEEAGDPNKEAAKQEAKTLAAELMKEDAADKKPKDNPEYNATSKTKNTTSENEIKQETKESSQQLEMKENSYIDKLIADMTLEEQLAQMMIMTHSEAISEETVLQYQPGGIVLFAVDFRGKTKDEMTQRIASLQSQEKLPMIIGIDEEGGEVSRIKVMAGDEIPESLGAREEALLGQESVFSAEYNKASFLKDMGINVNFAPVADVADKGSYMYNRSASSDPLEVSNFVTACIEAMHENDIATCVKHFPGYGSNGNTHKRYAVDQRSYEEYEEKDFLPFQVGIAADTEMIMVSHVVMSCVDEENPASLSWPVHKILRQDMQYDGIIIADEIQMKAITNQMSLKEATKKALLAGNDMIFSYDMEQTMEGALEAVESGELTQKQIKESLRRILRMKIKRGIITIPEGDTYGE